MEWYFALGMLLGMLILFMATGLPVAFSFFAVNLVGAVVFLGGEAGLMQLVRNAVWSVTTFSLAPIPLFILMGEIMFHTGMAFRAIDAVDRLIARVPGRLSLVAVTGGTIFSTLSGSTMANVAMLGSSLLPEMQRRGYHPSMAMGPILGTGGIAMLIPPSALAVLLASLAQMPVAELLIAGIVPRSPHRAALLRLYRRALPPQPRSGAGLCPGETGAGRPAHTVPDLRSAADDAVRPGRRQHPRRLGDADGIGRAGARSARLSRRPLIAV